ncbi:thioredoxin family protein [Noviherbaspirillum pedocola]|uniref:Thioredoxin family protein n=1 Tax=Noviherbaspirillum pedocola TaxID=2801341 RepID=A0A934W7N2_9BURK|nr:thioredoxin family protein [Noviherbaspirillum pedocola]MBK4735793.1 thioredoxin family protein [Noviherbaspirillum pedocola]
MSCLTLETDNRSDILEAIAGDRWIVACLCAAWCDVCRQYRPSFEELAARHPDKQFLWIDVEDQADVVGELDVENFPTILIQRDDIVAFYGTMLPEARQLHRLIEAQTERSADELLAEAQSSSERRQWQDDCNLRSLLADSLEA